MNAPIYWQRPDGGFSQTTPCGSALPGETVAQYRERVATTILEDMGVTGWLRMADDFIPPSPTPTPAQKQAALEAMIQQRLDARAQSMNFDNLLSGIANASLPVGEYRQADGAALLLWRARTWQKAAQIRDAFLAGTRPEPTWAEVEAELPNYPIGA